MIGHRDEKILKEFGNKLKKYRLAKKISIRKLALEADIDWSGLHRIELGQSNPTLTTIILLAEALGIKPADLLP